MFGEGKIANFEDLLDTKLSPFLSSVFVFWLGLPVHVVHRLTSCPLHSAYQFWRANASAFRKCFHMQGYSGHALRLAKWAFFFGGVRGWVRRFVEAETVEEQGRIWDMHLKPVLLAPWITRLFFSNPYVLVVVRSFLVTRLLSGVLDM